MRNPIMPVVLVSVLVSGEIGHLVLSGRVENIAVIVNPMGQPLESHTHSENSNSQSLVFTKPVIVATTTSGTVIAMNPNKTV